MIRPRVPGPTGIIIGEPVSVAVRPRTRPSVPIETLSDSGLIGIPRRAYHPWQSFEQHSRLDVANTEFSILAAGSLPDKAYSDLEN